MRRSAAAQDRKVAFERTNGRNYRLGFSRNTGPEQQYLGRYLGGIMADNLTDRAKALCVVGGRLPAWAGGHKSRGLMGEKQLVLVHGCYPQ
jgi:hypothetical protein